MAGDTTNDQRKDDEEKANLSETLKSRTETLGEEHWDTLETMHDLAYLLKCRGEYDEAERLLQKAVAILERKIGKDDPETIHSMGCLAVVLSEHAKYGEAETIHRQILESKERVLGKEHPQTLRYREKLAWILYNQGKYQKARELYPPPPKQQDPNVIVMEMDDTSRLDEAEKIYRGSMELKERLLGEEDPETLVSMSRLAGWLSGQCKRIEAEMLYRRLLRLREKVLGTDDEATLESKNSLAQVLSKLGKYLNAEKILQELVEVQERVFGKNHPKVLKTMGALPMVLKELGRLDDAEKTLRQLVALKSSLHGEEHLETLESMNDLAIVVAEREQYAEAERIFRQIMEIREKALGKGDPKTLSSLSYLAVMLEKQGKCDQAEEILERQPLCSTEAEAEAETEGDVGDTAKEDGFFKYQPLKSTRSTRVINLYPSRYKSATLVCELSEVELDDNNPPSYGAISYACESQTPNKRIFCHGKKFLVTENVEGILRQFRQPEKMSYLWIDAISISQTSTEERDQQILIMEDIYRLADVVAVWLGPSKELTAAAFKYFTTMAQSRHYSKRPISESKEAAEANSVDPKALSMEILGRSWFTRMWTVQEVGMSSPGAAKLCCGREMMEWDNLATAISTGGVEGVPASARSAMQIFYRLETLFQSVRASSKEPGSVGPQALLRGFTPLAGILEILVEIRGRASTDPRDKVFALHGILTSFEAHFPDPSYTKPVEQVFRETAEAVIRHDNRQLHILYHVSSRARMPNLPSWAPDWSDPDVVANTPSFDFWHASHHSYVDCTFSNSVDTASLLCSGKIIDKISHRARALREEIDLTDDEIEVFKDWIRCIKHITDSYSTGESLEAAFYWTLVQIPWSDNGLCIPLSSTLRKKRSSEAFEVWAQIITASKAAPESTSLEGDGKTFHDSIRATLCGQGLFVTEKQLMGTGWNTIQEGDVVALLSGVEMPMILRPAKHGYQIVTWAYIHGIMDGESWPGKDQLDTITLV